MYGNKATEASGVKVGFSTQTTGWGLPLSPSHNLIGLLPEMFISFAALLRSCSRLYIIAVYSGSPRGALNSMSLGGRRSSIHCNVIHLITFFKIQRWVLRSWMTASLKLCFYLGGMFKCYSTCAFFLFKLEKMTFNRGKYISPGWMQQ